MNKELIQQLLDRACYDEQDRRELEDWCNVEKFAESLIRECAKVCKAQSTYDPIVLPYKPSEQFEKAILEHFRVEP